MGTALHGILNIAQQSLANNQAALTVVSNNISNMNTENYSKQTVKFSALPAYDSYNWCSSIGSLQIGHGAQITNVLRNREQWLDNYYRDQNCSTGYYEQMTTVTNNIENLLNNELSSNGLQKSLTDFFSASQALTAEPANNAYRLAFIDAAEDVADYFNNMSSTINYQRKQLVGEVGDPDSLTSSTLGLTINDLNSKLAQLAEINGDIAHSYSNGSASCDILDKRDAILDEISKIIPVTITTNENLTVNVMLGNQTVVKAGEQKLFFEAVQTEDADNPVQVQLLNKDGDVRVKDASEFMTKGSIKAILDAGGSGELSYKSVLNEIDRLAKAFADELNKIQTGIGADGVADSVPYCISNGVLTKSVEPLFVSEDGGDFNAGNIKINSKLLKDPSLVATARGDASIEGTVAIGNTQNMKLFNDIQNLQLASLSNGGTGQTMDNFIKTLVTDLGSKIEALNAASKNQQSTLQQAESKRAEIMGVDLNQELMDLIKYQRAYEASARVFTVASELMETVVNLGR